MTAPEILLIIIGLAFLVISFLLVDRSETQQDGNNVSPDYSSVDFEQKKAQIREFLETEISNCMITTDEKLSQLSNETIMTVNDFAEQLLEKIQANNSEVVFLYNMLQQKEEEIKTTFQLIDTTKKDIKELMDKLSGLVAIKGKQLSKPSETNSDNNSKQKLNQDKKQLSNQYDNKIGTEEKLQIEDESNSTKESQSEIDNKENIIRLYKQQKTVREISKELRLGQSEVKLVIDLYGTE